MRPPQGNKPGRRAYVPSDADRETVRKMAGARHADIARVIGISVPTLRKAFAAELAAANGGDLFDAEAAPRARRESTATSAGGRKAFRPSDAQRRRVMELAAVGKRPSAIARVLQVSEPTLRKHFAEELTTGAERVEAEVIAALMSKARSGNVSALKEARTMIAQARLEAMEAALGAAEPTLKPETPGKKLQASMEAARIIEEAEWAEHLRPN